MVKPIGNNRKYSIANGKIEISTMKKAKENQKSYLCSEAHFTLDISLRFSENLREIHSVKCASGGMYLHNSLLIVSSCLDYVNF